MDMVWAGAGWGGLPVARVSFAGVRTPPVFSRLTDELGCGSAWRDGF